MSETPKSKAGRITEEIMGIFWLSDKPPVQLTTAQSSQIYSHVLAILEREFTMRFWAAMSLPTATKADYDLAHDITHPNALSYEDRVECNIGEPLPLLLALMRVHGYEMPKRNGDTMNDTKQAGSAVVGEGNSAAINDIKTALDDGGPKVMPAGPWRERWYGSEPKRGYAIVDGREEIAYLGPNVDGAAVTAIVYAHNLTVEILEQSAGAAAPVLPDLVDEIVEAARSLGHWETLRSTSQETIDYWSQRLDGLKTTLRSQRDEAFNEGVEAAAKMLNAPDLPSFECDGFLIDRLQTVHDIRSLKRPIPIEGGTQ